jgi:hypothetical protein
VASQQICLLHSSHLLPGISSNRSQRQLGVGYIQALRLDMCLQDVHIPAMLYHGPALNGVVLVTKRVFGRPLQRGGQDAHLVQLALAPLRAVHAAGFLVRVSGCSNW